MTEPTPNDAAYWDAIYAAEESPGWNLEQPAPPLAAWFGGGAAKLHPPGRILVPGCGFGHEVAMLARLGFRAEGLDMAPRAREGASRRLAAAGLEAPLHDADFFELANAPERAATYDGLVEHTCFCAILPERRADYARAAAALVRPGGYLVGLFYNHGRPEGPPFDTTKEDVAAAFGGAFDIEQLEPAADSVEPRVGRELFAVLRRR
ncbi:methyltransferase domain-containing protein [Candidatus Poribacteria bacterium]|nr:methyltransferase domain-containing protein [Candidatus Poribacteria bacterium]